MHSYHKFTRGKDFSNYKEDDIACILGSKRAKVLAERKAAEEAIAEDQVGHVNHINGVTTIKGRNMKVRISVPVNIFIFTFLLVVYLQQKVSWL